MNHYCQRRIPYLILEKQDDCMSNINDVNVDTWEDLETRVRTIRDERMQNAPIHPTVIFRGHSCSAWSLETTLERYGKGEMLFADYYRLISKIRPAIETYTDKSWILRSCPAIEHLVREYDKFSLCLTGGSIPGYEYMAYLRHHGFPSPLLDWTQSLYVAAYFAFRQAATSRSTDDDGRVSIFMWIKGPNGVYSSDYDTVFALGTHIRAHRRHMLQQSHYTVCLGWRQNSGWRFIPHERATNADNVQGNMTWKFNIPKREYQKVLKSLDEHNLNGFSLFGSEEGLMESLAIKEMGLK